LKIIAFSKAMYSTWAYYAPDRILFDCGEGISTLLTNKVFAVQKIFLSHSHADHISGLWGFLNTRNSAMGEREKPLEIYYPSGSRTIRKYLDFILDSRSKMRYDLSICEIDSSFQLPLESSRNLRSIRAFETEHMEGEKTLGFQVFEQRKCLKPEFAALNQREIRNLVLQNGRDAVTGQYEQNLFTFSGDGLPLASNVMQNTDLLFHEATFLDRQDIRGETHTVLEDLLENVLEAKPKKLIVYHISSRYNPGLKSFMKKVEKLLLASGIGFDYVRPGKICFF